MDEDDRLALGLAVQLIREVLDRREMRTIDADTAIAELRTAVAGRENHVYTSPEGYTTADADYHCVYAHNNEPHCLIGVVLHQLGVPLPVLSGLPADRIKDPTVRQILRVNADIRFNVAAVNVLVAAQVAQDIGHTWGRALQDAESAYRRITDNNREEAVAA